MKKLPLIIALTILPLIAFSQSIFDKFEDLENVTAVVINKNMFKLLTKIDIDIDDPEAQEFIEIAESLNGLKVFATENKKIAQDMSNTVSKYLKNSSLEELMRVKDEEANVKFYIKQGKDEDHVSELLMFVSGIKDVAINDGRKVETVLVTLTGNIDLNKIGSLTKKMNLPSELEKAGKKKKN